MFKLTTILLLFLLCGCTKETIVEISKLSLNDIDHLKVIIDDRKDKKYKELMVKSEEIRSLNPEFISLKNKIIHLSKNKEFSTIDDFTSSSVKCDSLEKDRFIIYLFLNKNETNYFLIEHNDPLDYNKIDLYGQTLVRHGSYSDGVYYHCSALDSEIFNLVKKIKAIQ